MRTTILIIVVALLGALGGWWAGTLLTASRDTPIAPGVAVLTEGEIYRDIALADLSGATRRLSELDGKPRLINFWATWCGPCVEEMPLLQALHQERGDELHVIGIALDEPEQVRRFVAELGVNYTILLDRPGPADASVAFGDTRGVLPYTVLLDAQGRMVDRHFGSFNANNLREFADRVR
jgi:thiol-disulfide isomerase/thioredoxin